MAAGPWVPYNDLKAAVLKKLLDLSADTIKVMLVASTSNAMNAALVSAIKATVTNELSTSGGYTAGGAAAASPTVAGGGATATITFDTANVSWTGSGLGFVARAAVMYDDTAASKDLIAYCLLNSAPADVTILTGETLTLTIVNVLSLT